MKQAIAVAALTLTSLAACSAHTRIGEMDSTRNRPVAHLTEAAVRNHEQLFPGYESKVKETDPELIEIFDNFAFDEVLRHGNLDPKTRVMVILASTIASQALSEYRMMLGGALNVGVTPVEAKEILYQAVPYVGLVPPTGSPRHHLSRYASLRAAAVPTGAAAAHQRDLPVPSRRRRATVRHRGPRVLRAVQPLSSRRHGP